MISIEDLQSRDRDRGRLTNLAGEVVALPTSVMLDTSIVAALWLPGTSGVGSVQKQRAAAVLDVINARSSIGHVALQSSVELAHLIAVSEYKGELLRNQEQHLPALRARFPHQRRFSWSDLMKVDDQPFVRAAMMFRTLCAALQECNVQFLYQPGEGTTDGRSYPDILAQEMERHGLDSADAAILLDARRAGIDAIVTFDTDLQRASRDFHIFTWL